MLYNSNINKKAILIAIALLKLKRDYNQEKLN